MVDRDLARSPELSETRRLADRRFVVTGDRAWALGTADGHYPAAGFHTRGEMGGFWLPNLKLLDGMWFGINGDWIGPATRTTSGWGYVRADLPTTNGVRASRTDFVPGRRLRRPGRAEPAGQPEPDDHGCAPTPTPSCSAPTPGVRPPRARLTENLPDSVDHRRHDTWCSATRATRRIPTVRRTTGRPPSAPT